MGSCTMILGLVIYLVLLVSLSYSASSPPHVILILADDLVSLSFTNKNTVHNKHLPGLPPLT